MSNIKIGYDNQKRPYMVYIEQDEVARVIFNYEQIQAFRVLIQELLKEETPRMQ